MKVSFLVSTQSVTLVLSLLDGPGARPTKVNILKIRSSKLSVICIRKVRMILTFLMQIRES